MPSPSGMPEWMDSPSNRASTSRWLSGRPPPSHPSNFVSRLLGDRASNHSGDDDEEDDSEEDERLHHSHHDEELDGDDLEQQALGEREPLLPLDNGSLSASVLSPSTGGQAALLRRRNFRGLRAKREWTDAFFLGCLATYWIGMLALAIAAFSRESNVSFAKYIKDGVDFKGQSCGTDRFVYFPDFHGNPDFGVCVDACPERAGEPLSVLLPLASGKRDANGSHALQEVTFTSYATHAWTYVCAPAGGASLCRSHCYVGHGLTWMFACGVDATNNSGDRASDDFAAARHDRALCRRAERGMLVLVMSCNAPEHSH